HAAILEAARRGLKSQLEASERVSSRVYQLISAPGKSIGITWEMIILLWIQQPMMRKPLTRRTRGHGWPPSFLGKHQYGSPSL
ncbi:hypothetical protein HAX54_033274, partial [Datura stramonium]|nr:hypothetical protein [Datura stramonium]